MHAAASAAHPEAMPELSASARRRPVRRRQARATARLVLEALGAGWCQGPTLSEERKRTTHLF